MKFLYFCNIYVFFKWNVKKSHYFKITLKQRIDLHVPGCSMLAWPTKTLVVGEESQFLGLSLAVTKRILWTVKWRDSSYWTIITISFFTLQYLGIYVFFFKVSHRILKYCLYLKRKKEYLDNSFVCVLRSDLYSLHILWFVFPQLTFLFIEKRKCLL